MFTYASCYVFTATILIANCAILLFSTYICMCTFVKNTHMYTQHNINYCFIFFFSSMSTASIVGCKRIKAFDSNRIMALASLIFY